MSDKRTGTAGQRKAAARAARARRRQRQQYYYIGAIVAAVAFVMIVIISMNQPVETPDMPLLGYYEELPAGQTDKGFFRLGEPDAPVTLTEYSSFACGHCREFSATIHQLIPYVQEGDLAIAFAPILTTQRTALPTYAVLCAGAQDPIAFWQMQDVMFAWMGEAYGQAQIFAAAEQLGLNIEEMNACFNDTEAAAKIIQQAKESFEDSGFTGTPSITINDDALVGNQPYDTVVQYIERYLENE